jgi:hypothetical protein
MMKKMAIFVEGQTEGIFVSRLVKELAGRKNFLIKEVKAEGTGVRRSNHIISMLNKKTNVLDYYFLIFDCGQDERVQSDIREVYPRLISHEFTSIVGIRDVYPTKRADLPRLSLLKKYGLKTNPVDPSIILAIMEVEAWFIAEHTHFIRIDSTLTAESIFAALGFNPATEDAQLRDHPAADLNAIYRLAGHTYGKKRWEVERTVNCLDYDLLYMHLAATQPSLGELVTEIDQFLT